MARRRIRAARLTLAVLGSAVVLGAVPTGTSPAMASGGGGCGRPVTDAHGTTIRIRGYCFGPTVLHAKPGEAITWTNLDPFPHAVTGASAAWGNFESLEREDTVTYRFNRPGVYPYTCPYHPGMVGAMVVGSGGGRGGAKLSTVQPGAVTLVRPSPQPPPATEPVLPPARERTGLPTGDVAALVAFALALWTALVLGIQRHRMAGGSHEVGHLPGGRRGLPETP